MAQFEVYRLADGELILDLQTDLLTGIESRVVVPLMDPGEAPIPQRRLNPSFVIEGRRYVMVTQFLASIDGRALSVPIANLDNRFDDIRSALDMIFLGF